MFESAVTPPATAEDLKTVDAALIRLRRFTSAGSGSPGPSEHVDMSTVLIVDAIARAGGEASPAHLSAALGVTASTCTRLIDRATTAGAVQRVPSAADRRRVTVRLTDAGTELDRRALRHRIGRLEAMLAEWTPERIARFAEDLADFAEASAEREG